MKTIGRSPRNIRKPEHGGRLAAQFPGRDRLTPREYQVLELIAGGSSNKEAGRLLGISPRTIEVHRAHIMDKLGARNSVDLVHKVMPDRG
jgi:two-component system, LuxR family, response regulator FixJ